MTKRWTLGALTALALVSCTSSHKIVQSNTDSSSFPVFDAEAHRGGRGLLPENTIPAMLNAIDLGVTTLEMDAGISHDKQVVVSHDPYFNADITTTPEGGYLTKKEGSSRLLYSMDYDSIRRYDVGLKPYPAFPRQKKVAAHKPLLSELIRATEAYAKQKGLAPLWYNIETKSTQKGDGVRHPAPEEFVELLMQVIQKEGIADRTIVQSFDPRTLQVLHRKYPAIKTSLLIDGNEKRSLDEQLKDLGFTPFVYSPAYALVSPQLVKACHDKGMKVVPWTPNTPEQIQKAREANVDGIITDFPDLFKR